MTMLLAAGGMFASCAGGPSGGIAPSMSQRAALPPTMLHTNTTPAPTVLWLMLLYGGFGGFGPPGITIKAVNVATGATIYDANVGPQIGSDIITSPDQPHVYATISRGGGTYIADYSALSLQERYYKIPYLASEANFTGLAVSPDGTRLYAAIEPTAGSKTAPALWAINTVTRTYAGHAPIEVGGLTISTDGRTLYGITTQGLTAVDAATLTVKASTVVTSIGPTVVSPTKIYRFDNSAVAIYDATTLRHSGEINLPSFPAYLIIDNAESLLYVGGFVSNTLTVWVIDTTTSAIVKTLHGVQLLYGGSGDARRLR